MEVGRFLMFQTLKAVIVFEKSFKTCPTQHYLHRRNSWVQQGQNTQHLPAPETSTIFCKNQFQPRHRFWPPLKRMPEFVVANSGDVVISVGNNPSSPPLKQWLSYADEGPKRVGCMKQEFGFGFEDHSHF